MAGIWLVWSLSDTFETRVNEQFHLRPFLPFLTVLHWFSVFMNWVLFQPVGWVLSQPGTLFQRKELYLSSDPQTPRLIDIAFYRTYWYCQRYLDLLVLPALDLLILPVWDTDTRMRGGYPYRSISTLAKGSSSADFPSGHFPGVTLTQSDYVNTYGHISRHWYHYWYFYPSDTGWIRTSVARHMSSYVARNLVHATTPALCVTAIVLLLTLNLL
jgi:hypothetical protein